MLENPIGDYELFAHLVRSRWLIMANSMKECNKQLFARVLAKVPIDLADAAKLSVTRYVATDPTQKERLKHVKILHSEAILPHVTATCLSVRAEYFVAWSTNRARPSHFSSGIIEDMSTCAGLATFLWSGTDWPLSDSDGYRVAEVLLDRDGSFDQAELAEFFAPTVILRVEESILHSFERGTYSAQRPFAVTLLAENRVGLPMLAPTRARLQTILEGGAGRIVGDQIFRATSAVHWQHLYLDVYRCIERLYTIPYAQTALAKIRALHAPLAVPTSAIEEILVDSLGWRPKELDALTEVLRHCPDVSIQQGLALFGISSAPDAHHQLARQIYALRNQCAHFRGGRNSDKFVGDWARLIDVLVELLNGALVVYGKDLE